MFSLRPCHASALPTSTNRAGPRAKQRAVAGTLHPGRFSLVYQFSPRPDSLGNSSWIQFHLWPLSQQLGPQLHKRPSFTLNVRTPSSPDPYYHMNAPQNGTGSQRETQEKTSPGKTSLFFFFELPKVIFYLSPLCVFSFLWHVNTRAEWYFSASLFFFEWKDREISPLSFWWLFVFL